MSNIHAVLDEDRQMITYRPSWRQITGSITSAILLQQVRFRWLNNGCKPFYKFIQPPRRENSAYREGDSWIEELGFTLAEFQGAVKKIGKRLSLEEVKSLPDALKDHFFGYFTDQKHLTWFYFNEDFFARKIDDHYGEKGGEIEPKSDQIVADSPFSKSPNGESPNGKLPNGIRLGNSQMVSVSQIPKRISETTQRQPETTNNLKAELDAPSSETETIKSVWEKTLLSLKGRMMNAQFSTHFEGTIPVSFEGGYLIVPAKSRGSCAMVNARMKALVEATAKQASDGLIREVDFVFEEVKSE